MSAREPGSDLHEWESEMQALGDDLRDSPAEALPELDRLIERMLVERGYAPEDAVAAEGDEPEVLAQFRAAREITRAAERDDAGPGDVAAAIDAYRSVYDYVVAERSAP